MGLPKNSTSEWTLKYAPAIIVGASYFVAAMFSLWLTAGANGIASVWPASGIYLACLLLLPTVRWPPVILAVAAASFLSNYASGAPQGVALAYTFANVIEGVLIGGIVRLSVPTDRQLNDIRWVTTFFIATCIGSASSAALAGFVGGNQSDPFIWSWFLTVWLGNLIVTPLILVASRGLMGRTEKPGDGRLFEICCAGAVVLIVSLFAFAHDGGRYLFLPVIAVVIMSYLFGSLGAAVSIGLVTVVATFCSVGGIMPEPVGNFEGEVLFLQFYLLCLLCAAWPLTVFVADKRRLLQEVTETKDFLEMAERAAKLGHWHMSADRTSFSWSNEVYRIHGIAGDYFDGQSTSLSDDGSLNLYHKDDRESVRTILQKAISEKAGFTYEARIVRPDGAVRTVSSTGHPHFDAEGEFDGIFGTIQDVTTHSKVLEALDFARTDALRQAERAQRASETDDLTGLPNRRKILSSLEMHFRDATQKHAHLTIAMVDVDHFKRVNDCFGHHSGDLVLQQVAGLLRTSLRNTDLVARLGGEEFLIVLPSTNTSVAYEILDRLRHNIETADFQVVGLDQVTVSVGIAGRRPTDNIDCVLQRADAALYEAKRDGRNVLSLAA